MRRVIAVTLVALMTAVGCGGGGTVEVSLTEPADVADAAELREPSPADLGAASRAADLIIGQMGDETAALAAVLLAADRGYGVAQIVEAGTNGRMAVDGVLMAVDGSTLVPEFEAPDLLIDDVTGTDNGPFGFQAQPERKTVSEALGFIRGTDNPAQVELATLLAVLSMGYSLGQYLEAKFSGGVLFIDKNRAFIYDANSGGAAVRPADLSNWRWTDSLDDYQDAADHPVFSEPEQTAPEPPANEGATEPAAEEVGASPPAIETDDEEFADLVFAAAQVYLVDPDTATTIADTVPKPTVDGVPSPLDRSVEIEGEMVIGADGSVSGEVSWTITDVDYFFPGGYTSWRGFDVTLEPTTVELLDDGLHFTTTAVRESFWGAENIPTTSERVTDQAVQGYVDVDIGQIVITGLSLSVTVDTIHFEAYD